MSKTETQAEGLREPDAVESRLEDGKYLPPIYRIKLPETRTKSALIRWLWELGYSVKAISASLGIRYQQVRNVVTTEPKRATREDMPELVIVLADVTDVVDMLLGEALEADFRRARKNRDHDEDGDSGDGDDDGED